MNTMVGFSFFSVDLHFQLSLQFDHCMDPSYKTPTCLRASPSYIPGKLRKKSKLKIRWYRSVFSNMATFDTNTCGDCEALQSKSRYRLGICNWNLLAFNFVQFLWTCNKKSQLCKYKIECNMVVNLDAVWCHVSIILTCQRFEEAVFRFCLLFGRRA